MRARSLAAKARQARRQRRNALIRGGLGLFCHLGSAQAEHWVEGFSSKGSPATVGTTSKLPKCRAMTQRRTQTNDAGSSESRPYILCRFHLADSRTPMTQKVRLKLSRTTCSVRKVKAMILYPPQQDRNPKPPNSVDSFDPCHSTSLSLPPLRTRQLSPSPTPSRTALQGH